MTYALRNVRVLIRRVLTAMDDGEKVPEVLPVAVGLLAGAVELLKQEWARGVEPVATRERALRAVAEAMRAYDAASASPGASWSPRSAPRPATCCGPPGWRQRGGSDGAPGGRVARAPAYGETAAVAPRPGAAGRS